MGRATLFPCSFVIDASSVKHLLAHVPNACALDKIINCNIPLQTEKSSKTCKFYFIASYELEIYKDNNLHDCTARSKMPTHR